MGIKFDGAASGINTTTLGITPAYPFTVGIWFNLRIAQVADGMMWGVANTGNTTAYWSLTYDINTGGTAIVSGANRTSDSTSNIGTWAFAIGRFISATNRRLTTLAPQSVPTNLADVQNTTSSTPSGFNNECIGYKNASTPTLFFDGSIAEGWRTNSDIQPDGGVLLTSTLYQLAYRGPYSISSVAEKLVWYKSFRQSIDQTSDTLNDPEFSVAGRTLFTQTATKPTQTDHPAFLYTDFVGLNTLKQKLTV